MNTGVISKRYAKALYMYAEKAGKVRQVYDEMSVMANNYLLVPGIRKAIDNPLLPMNDRIKLLCNAAGGKVSEEVERFITLVLHEHREKFMQFIACSYVDLYRKKNNIFLGKLITAEKVSKETEDRMRMMIVKVKGTQGTVEFETCVEPSIIGGFILDIDYNRLDASVAAQLNRVRRQFMEKNRRIV